MSTRLSSRSKGLFLVGQALTSSCVNLYHLVDLLVKPATASRDCSFVELMAEGPQPCKWFVSHWPLD